MSAVLANTDLYEIPLPYTTQIAFTPAKDGLPVFHGKTFEDHVEAWKYVNESVECRLWALGAIAASLVKKYGDGDVKRFAGEVRLSRTRIYEIADTYRKFEKSERSDILSFHHHTVAAKAKDPVEAIHKAEDGEWSTRQLDRYVETGIEPSTKPDRPNRTLKSISRKVLADHIEFEAMAALLDLKTKCPDPHFATKYYGGWMQDLKEARDEILREDDTEALISAWHKGNHTTEDLARATGIHVSRVASVMHDQEEDGVFEQIVQGGETEQARGTRATVWHLIGQPVGSDYSRPTTRNRYENET